MINIGIVGTHFISDRIIAGGKKDPRFRVGAVFSRTEERGKAFASKYAIDLVYTDFEKFCESPAIDAVYIASPNICHAPQALEALRHGKHVLCEKAFASNAREAAQVIAEAEKQGLTLMEAMKSTLHPNFQVIRTHLRRLGVIRKYFASYCQYSSRYDQLKQGIVLNAFRPELSNGALMDIGVYTLYPLAALFGRPISLRSMSTLLYTGADGAGSALLEYPGMEAQVIYSKISDSYLPSEIQGEDGSLLIEQIHEMRRVVFYPRKGEPEDLSLPAEDEYFYEIKEFLDLVESGKTQSKVNTWENTLITLEMMDRIKSQFCTRK